MPGYFNFPMLWTILLLAFCLRWTSTRLFQVSPQDRRGKEERERENGDTFHRFLRTLLVPLPVPVPDPASSAAEAEAAAAAAAATFFPAALDSVPFNTAPVAVVVVCAFAFVGLALLFAAGCFTIVVPVLVVLALLTVRGAAAAAAASL